MQRIPKLIAFMLFLVLCASVTYWLLQWVAPPPRPVAALPQASRVMPPIAAAANLFGGRVQAGGLANVQLRGIVRAGRADESLAIIALEGKPARALRANAEVTSGVTLKAIHARSVVLSERGEDRELTLPAFAAQEGATPGMPAPSPQQSAQSWPTPSQAVGSGNGGATSSGSPVAPNTQPSLPVQRPAAAAQPEQAGGPPR